MSRSTCTRLACTLLALAAHGCVLPSFDKVRAAPDSAVASPDAAAADSGSADASNDAAADSSIDAGKTCGVADKLAPSCAACIHTSCCDQAQKCGQGTSCGADLLKPITPVTEVSTDFDELLGCMQDNCDAACNVSWGCVDHYDWPTPSADYNVGIHVIDFAHEPPESLPNTTVSACQSVDPLCKNGRVAQAVSGKDGKVSLKLPPGFDGFFSFSSATYAPAVTQWSQPLYRIADFTQYQLDGMSIAGIAVMTGVHDKPDDPFDPNVGHLIFRIQNCLPVRYLDHNRPHAEASGVKIAVTPHDGASPVFYTDKSRVVALDLKATSNSGVGGVFNLPPRNISVSATDAKTGKQLASGTVGVQKSTLSFMYMLPSAKD